jgi:hypothetical protein
MFEWLPETVHLWDNLSVCGKDCQHQVITDVLNCSCQSPILASPLAANQKNCDGRGYSNYKAYLEPPGHYL